MRILAIIIAAMLSVTLPQVSEAQDFAGDYQAALSVLRPLAEQGDASAQYNLGEMYGRGEGVPQNHQLAYMWSSLAFAQGFEIAVPNRDTAASLLTRKDLARAQQLSSFT